MNLQKCEQKNFMINKNITTKYYLMWVVFLISNFTFLLLICSKAAEFCILQPYILQPCYNSLFVLGDFSLFFQIFFIYNHVIYKQRQFYVLLLKIYTFYFIFLPYCISKNFQYDVEKEWWYLISEEKLLVSHH